MKRVLFIILAAVILIPIAVIGFEYLHETGGNEPSLPVVNAAEQISRGAYLARAGNCMGCHTARGGSPYAGGRMIPTPFGNLFAPNITPDAATGIGNWTANDFWRALHSGKSKDGSFLYPAFPYPNYTKVTRTDSDAMFAYFRSLQPVNRPNRRHELRFPYNQRFLLGVWRALYFQPGVYQPQPDRSVEWNRGAYLVQGLGHCNACHTNRNALGATEAKSDLAGGMIPILNWYASSLASDKETGLGEWQVEQIAQLLKTGVSQRGVAFGPMAEVVRNGLQHLTDADIAAMAGYLKSLPRTDSTVEAVVEPASGPQTDAMLRAGAKLYEKHCVECHGKDGAGIPPAYPPLAGNRGLTSISAINPIRMVLNGGYPPSTAGNPRPYGMPPFGPALSDGEVAALVSFIRNAWGNSAPLVTATEVSRFRAAPLE